MRSLLHVEPTFATTSLAFTATGLNGEITGYREVSTASAPRTALNSTSVERQPSSYAGSFVRGKSSYFPFRPGGLNDPGLDHEGEGDAIEDTTDKMETAFEKGHGRSMLSP